MIKTEPVLLADTRQTIWRTLQTFCVTRIVIAVTLLIYLSLNTRQGFWVTESFPYREACGIYVVQAIIFFIISAYERRRLILQVTAGILVDIFVITLLYIAASGAKGGMAILYLFPLAGGAILAPLPLALFFVSIVTILLLLENGYHVFPTLPDESTSQAGLYGAAFFAAAYVINRLAAKLIRQENLAVQRGRDLQIQQEINRLVIEDMEDGILVLSPDSTIHIANPAAQRMLGLVLREGEPAHQLIQISALKPIAAAWSEWAASQSGNSADNREKAVLVRIKWDKEQISAGFSAHRKRRRQPETHLKLRFASVETGLPNEKRTVIFLQDVSEIENQAQQLKLASMGRLTASIAHEVRNPLSAVAHAASLLKEEVADPAHARLLRIIGDNVTRLNRMVEDILKLSRKAQPPGEPILLAETIEEIVNEFRETHGVRAGLIRLEQMHAQQVLFDPLHLHEVIVNLLANALRYASGADESIRIHLSADAGRRLELHIEDDGPPISPEVRSHLFEPFYTTSSKGTGLGLYMARELCLNNGAALDYEYDSGSLPRKNGQACGRFVITFAHKNTVDRVLAR